MDLKSGNNGLVKSVNALFCGSSVFPNAQFCQPMAITYSENQQEMTAKIGFFRTCTYRKI